MSVRRRVALGGGLLAAAVGLALAVRPTLLSEPDLGEWAVSVLGAIALLYASGPLYRRRKRSRTVASGPDPENPLIPPAPGEDVDDLLAVAGDVYPRTVKRRRRLHRRLHAAAVAAVEQRESCDQETARRMVAAGTWTDDDAAASYFSEGAVVTPGDVPLYRRIRLRLSETARRAYVARRVVDVVAATTRLGGGRTAAESGNGRTVTETGNGRAATDESGRGRIATAGSEKRGTVTADRGADEPPRPRRGQSDDRTGTGR